MPNTHPSINLNFFSFSWRVFQKVSLVIFVNNNSRRSSEKTRFSLQVCVPYLIRKQNDEWRHHAQYELNTSILEYVKPEIRNTYVFPISSQCAKRATNRILLLHTESWWLNGSQSLSFTHLYMSYSLWVSYLFTKLWLLFVTAAILFCLQENVLLCKSPAHI